MKTIKGTLQLYSETGSEGGWWAIQDEKFIFPPTEEWPHEHWSYDGLHYLKDGDHLKIFDLDGTVYWEGEISLKRYPVFTESVPIHDENANVDLGLWIHADQNGLDRQFWARPFLKNYKGELTRCGDAAHFSAIQDPLTSSATGATITASTERKDGTQ